MRTRSSEACGCGKGIVTTPMVQSTGSASPTSRRDRCVRGRNRLVPPRRTTCLAREWREDARKEPAAYLTARHEIRRVADDPSFPSHALGEAIPTNIGLFGLTLPGSCR